MNMAEKWENQNKKQLTIPDSGTILSIVNDEHESESGGCHSFLMLWKIK